MSDVLELNVPAKPVKGEAHKDIENYLHELGVDALWVDRIMLNVSPARAEQYQHRIRLYKAGDCVDRLMTWTNTPEGHSFWSNVCHEFHHGNLNPVYLLSKE